MSLAHHPVPTTLGTRQISLGELALEVSQTKVVVCVVGMLHTIIMVSMIDLEVNMIEILKLAHQDMVRKSLR